MKQNLRLTCGNLNKNRLVWKGEYPSASPPSLGVGSFASRIQSSAETRRLREPATSRVRRPELQVSTRSRPVGKCPEAGFCRTGKVITQPLRVRRSNIVWEATNGKRKSCRSSPPSEPKVGSDVFLINYVSLIKKNLIPILLSTPSVPGSFRSLWLLSLRSNPVLDISEDNILIFISTN